MNLELPKPTDKSDEKLLSDVSEYGWHVLHIVSKEEKDQDFTYTVGVHFSEGGPELLIVGLPRETAHAILNDVAELIRNGEDLSSPRRISGVIENGDVLVRELEKEKKDEFLRYNSWFYQNHDEDFPAVQIYWPDRQGLLPDEEGYDSRFLEIQNLK